MGRACGKPDETESTPMGDGIERPVSRTLVDGDEVRFEPRELGAVEAVEVQADDVHEACARKRAVNILVGWVFSLISSGGQAPHVRCTPMMWALSTCGEPDETGLTLMGVALNGPGRRVPMSVEA